MKRDMIIAATIALALMIIIGGYILLSLNRKTVISHTVTFYQEKNVMHCECIDCDCQTEPIVYIKLTVYDGEKVSIPEALVKDDQEFVEWQLDGRSYDFNSPVTRDIALYAEWKSPEEEPVEETFKVTFYKTQDAYCDCIDCDCPSGPIGYLTIEVKSGETVSEPEVPTYLDHEFVEWQLDGQKYDFSTPVTSDLNLYTMWQSVN